MVLVAGGGLVEEVGLVEGVELVEGVGLGHDKEFDGSVGIGAGRNVELGKLWLSEEAVAVVDVGSLLPPPQALKTKDSDSSDKAVIRFKGDSCKRNGQRYGVAIWQDFQNRN